MTRSRFASLYVRWGIPRDDAFVILTLEEKQPHRLSEEQKTRLEELRSKHADALATME